MLSNLETPQSKLLQIMLVGQPELADKLSQPALRQLRQRVELRHAIRPLHRAGDRRRTSASACSSRAIRAATLFTGAAERAVYRFSRGIPRVINVLCDNALIVAFSRQSQRVSAQMVEEAARDLGLVGEPGRAAFRTRAQRTASRRRGPAGCGGCGAGERNRSPSCSSRRFTFMGKIHDALQQRGAGCAAAPRRWTSAVASSRSRSRPRPRRPSRHPACAAGACAARRRRRDRRACAARRGRRCPSGEATPYSEEYRTLRARIQSLRRTRELRSIVITSTRPGEGKTTTAVEPRALASGSSARDSVCLVDADLRTPRVHKAFRGAGPVRPGRGARGRCEARRGADRRTRHAPDGAAGARAADARRPSCSASRAMVDLVAELHTRFQTVIVDAPPVLGLPDTVTLVDLCDAALFVVGAGAAPRDEVESALERLDANKVIGVVLNRCEQQRSPATRAHTATARAERRSDGRRRRRDGDLRSDPDRSLAARAGADAGDDPLRAGARLTSITPTERKAHSAPVAMLGGVAVFALDRARPARARAVRAPAARERCSGASRSARSRSAPA